MKKLKEQRNKETAFFQAIEDGNLSLVEYYLKKGVSADTIDQNGKPAIFIALDAPSHEINIFLCGIPRRQAIRLPMLMKLIEYGADLSVTFESKNLLTYLLSDYTRWCQRNDTLEITPASDIESIIQSLAENGIYLNEQDEKGKLPIDYLVESLTIISAGHIGDHEKVRQFFRYVIQETGNLPEQVEEEPILEYVEKHDYDDGRYKAFFIMQIEDAARPDYTLR